MTCFQCDLAEILEATRPPDSDMLELIEWAFLEGQIDSLKAELAYVQISQTRAHSARDIN